MNVIEGTGEIVTSPDWAALLKNKSQVPVAEEHWRRLTAEMRGANTLSPANAHAIKRLVMFYLVHDRAADDAANTGGVTKPKRGNPKSIARVSPYFTVMKEAAGAAAALEAELGVSPRRRTGVGKVERKATRVTGADRFLKRVEK